MSRGLPQTGLRQRLGEGVTMARAVPGAAEDAQAQETVAIAGL
jgi:hypothetical protein